MPLTPSEMVKKFNDFGPCTIFFFFFFGKTDNYKLTITTILFLNVDIFISVCTSLIANGERQEEEGLSSRTRMKALSMLCHMNPGQALSVRAKCVSVKRRVCFLFF